KYKPDLFIEVDVTFATDYGDSLEENVGKCELGKGGVLYRGVDIDKNSLRLLEKIARKNKIKIQYQASEGNIGYTACEVSNYPTKILIIGIPLRNMHTPVEIINSKDLDYIIRLLTLFLLNRETKKLLE
ncbi:MAG: M42 family peptidase, partial [Thermoplasmata archaeon]